MRLSPQKLCGQAKNVHPCTFFKNFLDVGMFLALFEGFKGGCGPHTQQIGGWSTSPYFGALIKCVHRVGGAHGKSKYPKLTRVQEVGRGVTKKGAELRTWLQTDFQVTQYCPATRKSTEYNSRSKSLTSHFNIVCYEHYLLQNYVVIYMYMLYM